MAQLSDTRSRWLEIALSVGLSITTSAVVVSWTLSAMLADFKATLDAHAHQIAALEQGERTLQSDNAAQATSIAVNASQFSEVIRRLDSIDRALEHRK
jgi:mannitol-specific phosphotransferase system IIBC component